MRKLFKPVLFFSLTCRFILCVGIVLISGCASLNQTMSPETNQEFKGLHEKSQQVILVDPSAHSKAILSAWELNHGRWVGKFLAVPAMVGRSGVADLGEKREGDGKTPSGIFPLKLAFGYEKHIHTRLSYRQATSNDFWVDDVHSRQYNQWVTGKPDAASFEIMKRQDDLYQYGAVIEYNTDPVVTGMGSAIFLHVWRNDGQSTSGCVAISKNNLKKLLAWLDPKRNPVILIKTQRGAT
jgi:L,D-peptidoglycan transpeptidase YkuD (ErfK/YbiS/YcfS/YnhG family)